MKHTLHKHECFDLHRRMEESGERWKTDLDFGFEYNRQVLHGRAQRESYISSFLVICMVELDDILTGVIPELH